MSTNNSYTLDGRTITVSLDPTSPSSFHRGIGRSRILQGNISSGPDQSGSIFTSQIRLVRSEHLGTDVLLGQDWAFACQRNLAASTASVSSSTPPSAGPPAPSRSYCPVLLDGLPVTAENINMSPVSYHCRPHNRVVKALITGQDLYGTRFSTLLQLQPKPASLDTTADVLLGSDWLRDCAIHAIHDGQVCDLASGFSLHVPYGVVKDNVLLRWPLSHRSTGMTSGSVNPKSSTKIRYSSILVGFTLFGLI
ncbi:hypothetical protein C8J56DRAFT_1085207 [Mycena floridula]|nr:hypothetical protein C8J56DRAFT_1085207 [Mycena floridula]